MEQFCLLPEHEAVLSHLPQRDLLAQRVIRTWHEAISCSRVFSRDSSKQADPIYRLREKTFLAGFNPSYERCSALYPDDETLDRENACIGTSRESYPTGPDMLCAQAWFESETRRRAVLHLDASWRRLFPSDPAPRLARMDIWLC